MKIFKNLVVFTLLIFIAPIQNRAVTHDKNVNVEIAIENLNEFPGIKLIAVKKNTWTGELRKKILSDQEGIKLNTLNEQLEIFAVSNYLVQKSELVNLNIGKDRNIVPYPYQISANEIVDSLYDNEVISHKIVYRILGFKQEELVLEKISVSETLKNGQVKVRMYNQRNLTQKLFAELDEAILNEQFPYLFYLYPDKNNTGIHLELKGDYLGEFRLILVDKNGILKSERGINKTKKEWIGFIPSHVLKPGNYQLRLFRGRTLETRTFLIQAD